MDAAGPGPFFLSELLCTCDTVHEWSLVLMDAVGPGQFISFRTPV